MKKLDTYDLVFLNGVMAVFFTNLWYILEKIFYKQTMQNNVDSMILLTFLLILDVMVKEIKWELKIEGKFYIYFWNSNINVKSVSWKLKTLKYNHMRHYRLIKMGIITYREIKGVEKLDQENK